MVSVNQSSYAAYGAHELKATYQRNLLLGMLITTLLASGAASLTVLFLHPSKPPVVGHRDDLGGHFTIRPPNSIKPPSGPQVGGHAVHQEWENGPIPQPVVDSMLDETSTVIPTIEEKEIMVGFGQGMGGGEVTGIGEGDPSGYEEPLPPRGSFVAAEIEPELIYSVTPEYPRMAKEVGIEGTVVIQALVGKEGDVLDAVVFVSSGNALLDAAALAVAWKYKYRPAVQNGRPLAIWVTYNVEFKLER